LKEATLAYSGKQSLRGMTAAAESSLGYILRAEPARFFTAAEAGCWRLVHRPAEQEVGAPEAPVVVVPLWPGRTTVNSPRPAPLILGDQAKPTSFGGRLVFSNSSA